MKTVFADAGYWSALFNPRDILHPKAVALSQTLQDVSIVTSQVVLIEFLNHYAALEQQFRQSAVQVVRSLQQAPDVEIVPQTIEQFEDALTLFDGDVERMTGDRKACALHTNRSAQDIHCILICPLGLAAVSD